MSRSGGGTRRHSARPGSRTTARAARRACRARTATAAARGRARAGRRGKGAGHPSAAIGRPGAGDDRPPLRTAFARGPVRRATTTARPRGPQALMPMACGLPEALPIQSAASASSRAAAAASIAAVTAPASMTRQPPQRIAWQAAATSAAAVHEPSAPTTTAGVVGLSACQSVLERAVANAPRHVGRQVVGRGGFQTLGREARWECLAAERLRKLSGLQAGQPMCVVAPRTLTAGGKEGSQAPQVRGAIDGPRIAGTMVGRRRGIGGESRFVHEYANLAEEC